MLTICDCGDRKHPDSLYTDLIHRALYFILPGSNGTPPHRSSYSLQLYSSASFTVCITKVIV